MGGGPKGPGRSKSGGRRGRVRDLEAEIGLSQTQRDMGKSKAILWAAVSHREPRGRPRPGLGSPTDWGWRKEQLEEEKGAMSPSQEKVGVGCSAPAESQGMRP